MVRGDYTVWREKTRRVVSPIVLCKRTYGSRWAVSYYRQPHRHWIRAPNSHYDHDGPFRRLETFAHFLALTPSRVVELDTPSAARASHKWIGFSRFLDVAPGRTEYSIEYTPRRLLACYIIHIAHITYVVGIYRPEGRAGG